MSICYQKDNSFSPEFRAKLELWHNMAFAIINSTEIKSREEAATVKQMITHPLGVLNAKHGLVSSSGRVVQRRKRKKHRKDFPR